MELTCFGHEASSVTELLQVQPTWTSPLTFAGSPTPAPAWAKSGCVWHFDSASSVSSTKVSDHVQHLLAIFLPIKSRLEEMWPRPRIKVSVYWECTAFGVSGLTGPQLEATDLKGLAELGVFLEVKVIAKDAIAEG